jgi:pimeloyl-ACP methyl ester carboxylesterase
MTLCYVVPGLLGTELWAQTDPSPTRVWIDYTSIAAGGLDLLTLDPNGITARPGYPLVQARGVIETYYGTCISQLGQQLGPKGYTIRPWGYDWRIRIEQSGTALGLAIASEVRPTDPPCSIVAHSMGGLVARIAWRTLGRLGLQSLVRRIVTLGTPHQGSYVAFRALAGQDQATIALSLASFAGFAFSSLARNPIKGIYTIPGLCSIMGSWPGLYELLPMLGGTDAEADPVRHCVYADRVCPVSLTATYQSTPPIGTAWLAYARDVWWPQMRDDPTTLPPGNVLTTVAGSGFLTGGTGVTEFVSENLSTQLYVDDDRSGDGTVTFLSATIPSARRYTVEMQHVPMPDALAASGELAMMVLEDVPTPPPPPGVVAGVAGGWPTQIPAPSTPGSRGTDC